jgi:hypothetical protein
MGGQCNDINEARVRVQRKHMAKDRLQVVSEGEHAGDNGGGQGGECASDNGGDNGTIQFNYY